MARHQGRSEFTAEERTVVEFARYRCFLLGLPEELLASEPADIVHVMHARSALLRDGFDSSCQELVSGTMAAYLRPGTSLFDRCAGTTDLIRVALTTPFIIGRFAAVTQASRIPVLADITDAYVIGLLKLRLATYGKAEFTTDATHYTPVPH